MHKARVFLVICGIAAAIALTIAAPASAHDPFAQPPGGASGTGSISSGGGGPFNPGGSEGSSTATNGSTSSSTSSSSSSSSSSSNAGNTGSNTSHTSGTTHSNGSANNLPFTGQDPKPWFVIAYGLIAIGGSAIAFAKLSVV